jgi:hypothetical protein
MNVSLYHQTWQRARLALANYLYEAYGTDGCSQEGEDPCWIETARLKATHLDPNVLTEEEKEEAHEKKLAAQRARADGRAAALALVAAASNRKKRRRTQAMRDGDDEVTFEGQMSALRVDSTAGLPTPEPEPTENIDTTPPVTTSLLTTLAIRPKPLTCILKPSKTTNTTTLITFAIRSKPPTTILNLPTTTDMTPFNPNLDAISISPTHPPNNNTIRTVTVHPTATVQDSPVPYAHPHRAETEYRHMAYYNRKCESYEPKQWAADDTPTSGKEGKKRQREEDEDGDDSGDSQYKGAVFTTEEVARLGMGKHLRAKRS